MNIYPAIARAVGGRVVGGQWIALTVETNADLIFSNTMRLEVLHHRQRPASGQITIGQAIATVVGVTIKLDAIDRRIGLEKFQDHVQTRLGIGVQFNPAPREIDPCLAHLVVVHWQQLRGADLIIAIGLAEFYRQQAHFHRSPGFAGIVANHRTAAVEQTIDQTTGLPLGAGKQHAATRHAHRAQVDIATAWLPGRCCSQQGCRTCTQDIAARTQLKRRLFTGTAHELTTAEIGNRLDQAAFELIAFDLPLNILQTGLEGKCCCRQADKHTEQG
ncbi:hypothetical protein D3C76_1086210 [compost metagenome]